MIGENGNGYFEFSSVNGFTGLRKNRQDLKDFSRFTGCIVE
jgi:hypothetical protein